MKKLKILVFEYITGGGFKDTELPTSLAREGLIMLQALLDDLAELRHVSIALMLDGRMLGNLRIPPACRPHVLKPEHDVVAFYNGLIAENDAVWPLAPETGGLLARLCEIAEDQGKHLLCSGANVVKITGDKWQCYQHLVRCAISTIPTFLPDAFVVTKGEWVIKPRDGAGALETSVFGSEEQFHALLARYELDNTLVQPHTNGSKTSLSCLFRHGQAWLLCVNRQTFILEDGCYKMTGLLVNIAVDHSRYEVLVDRLANSFPDLWGYVGVDLIESANQIFVLEINPRLTTAFSGIKAALGLNCVALTLELLQGSPKIQPTQNRTTPITLD